ncbi:MAG TPA: threonine synthase [Clostridiales bacterium]|nr:threonine synthase [Clostridiales bacterium]
MKYHSTRNKTLRAYSMDVIKQGLSPEGGLFVPDNIPQIELGELVNADYGQRAVNVLAKFLTDYPEEVLAGCVKQAYSSEKFASPETAPIVTLKDGLHVLELWHGPTCAFKDMALQILPHLMTAAIRATGDDKEIIILTATSGDTGKAALEGFRDVPGTRILVFYPQQGVSLMQKLQMVNQEGSNVMVAAVEGNFDDAQTGVKQLFRDRELAEIMDRKGLRFSSANSINWGRLVPQIAYYISAYLDLVKKNKISLGEKVNIVVPTGNFGNILAAWYAKGMGLPVNRLICASNDNKVLSDFIRTGIYDRRREFYKTISPSMDILVSSNLERLLYDLSGRDDAQVRSWMEQLAEEGHYRIEGKALDKLQSEMWGGYASVGETLDSIRETFKKTGYTMDPHTAVGKWVYDSYRKETGDNTQTILVSTASPFKFPGDVLKALLEKSPSEDEVQLPEILAEVSGLPVPKPLKGLKDKKIRHTAVCSKAQMKDQVVKLIYQ